jgi:hypothetical protein
VSVCTADSGDELARLEFRAQVWNVTFAELMRNLAQIRPVIMCEDFNITHRQIARHKIVFALGSPMRNGVDSQMLLPMDSPTHFGSNTRMKEIGTVGGHTARMQESEMVAGGLTPC